MIKFLFLLLAPLSSFATGNGTDTEELSSVATVSINGTKFYEAESLTIEEFTFGEDKEYDIKGEIKIGRKKASFSITIPAMDAASYTRENDNLASVSLDLGSMYLSSSGPFVTGVEDIADHYIEITSVSDHMVAGSFVATLQNGTSTETVEFSGHFAIKTDFLAASAPTLVKE